MQVNKIFNVIINHFRNNCCWQQWVVIGIGMLVLAPIAIGGSLVVLIGGLICLFVIWPILNRII